MSDELREFINRRLRGYGLSQRQLGSRIGWDPSLISHLKNGTKVPAPDSRFVHDLGTELGCAEELARLVGRERQRKAGPRLIRPSQLGPHVPRLAGRLRVQQELDDAVAAGGVCVLAGPAGVGKTALALAWASEHEAGFSDGAVLVELHAHTPNRAEVSAWEALGTVLADLGVREIPHDAEARSRLLRSVLHGQRMLLVLDDATSAEQVSRLLPGAPGCAVVVTTRHASAARALAIRGPARHLDVTELDSEAAQELLAEQLAGTPAAQDSAALKRIAVACDGVPLALRAAASYVRAHPELGAAAAAERLSGPHRVRMLTSAAGGDAAASVQASLESAERHLPPAARSLLRRLACGEPTPVPPPAPGTADPIEALVEEGLVDPGRGAPRLRELAAAAFANAADSGLGRCGVAALAGA